LWGQYESNPLFGDATVMVRFDGNWRSRLWMDPNRTRGVAAFAGSRSIDPTWIVNGRLALRHLKIAGANAEVALWGKNLTDDRSATFALIIGGFSDSATYQPARTVGADLIIDF
jgi:iron complex outermembrane receptor protein